VAANYRAGCRARSKQEFVAPIGVVAEEADECVLWLELLTESRIVKPEINAELLKEARELTAKITASQQTAKRSLAQPVFNYSITKLPITKFEDA
jgi:four helix bundle protein